MNDQINFWMDELINSWDLKSETLATILQLSNDDVQKGNWNAAGLRVYALLTIYRRLKHFYPATSDQLEWLIRPNTHFENRKPLEWLMAGDEGVLWLAYSLESSQFLSAPKEIVNHA